VGLLEKTEEVVQTRITAIPAIIPVKAVSDNFVDKFAGNKERILPKVVLHPNASFWKKPGVVSVPGGGAVSSFSTVVSSTPIVPRRIWIMADFQAG
jgi:hypothetical protein